MSAPILYSCHFGGGQFTSLAKVLELTAARHCPLWDRRIEMIGSHSVRAAAEAFADNTHKLDRWNEFVQLQADGSRVLLLDADTFITNRIDDVWERPFDIAYTVRDASYRLPLNGGVVFLRVNDRTKALMAAWAGANRQMLTDKPLHRTWYRKFGGMNQASLGYVLSRVDGAPNLAISQLPCREWNCEDSCWDAFDSSRTRIVHVKSALRRAVFNIAAPRPNVRPLTKLWRALEREAMALPA